MPEVTPPSTAKQSASAPPKLRRRRSRPVLAAATRWALHHGVTTVARAARLTPVIWGARRQVMVHRNLSYVPGRTNWAHRLDVHRPRQTGPWPVVLYVHGGGFGLLSKDSHWHIATALASCGFWVANINYRLAPKHPYPAALEDVGAALAWVLDHAQSMDGNADQLVVAGESAGANLVTALVVALHKPYALPWVEALTARQVAVRAVLPACGLLEVADSARYESLTPLAPPVVLRHIRRVCERYTTGSLPAHVALGLASPLTLLESNLTFERALPPFLITCGSVDPIVSDSLRLHAALQARHAPTVLKLYAKEGHAFQALPWRAQAKNHWRDTVAYLQHHLQQ